MNRKAENKVSKPDLKCFKINRTKIQTIQVLFYNRCRNNYKSKNIIVLNWPYNYKNTKKINKNIENKSLF